jgi:hypothetical protein
MAQSLLMAVIAVSGAFSQTIQPLTTPAHYIRIDIPRALNSEGVFIRYILAGEDLGGWVKAHPDASSYIIDTTRQGQYKLQTRYIARRAQPFLGLGADIPLTIP